jgi:hypothetical protein
MLDGQTGASAAGCGLSPRVSLSRHRRTIDLSLAAHLRFGGYGGGSVPSRPMCRRPALCDASATTAEGQPCESWPSVQRSSLCARHPQLSSDGLRRWCAASPITTSSRTGLLRTSTETGRRSARPESQRPNTRFGPGQTERPLHARFRAPALLTHCPAGHSTRELVDGGPSGKAWRRLAPRCKESPRLRDTLQGMLTAAFELDPGPDKEIFHRAGDEYLTRRG